MYWSNPEIINIRRKSLELTLNTNSYKYQQVTMFQRRFERISCANNMIQD